MLKVTIPSIELYDEITNTFTMSKEHVIQLEHSLVSISKWESKWLKPFLTRNEKTKEETIDYIKCMTINNVDDDTYNILNNQHFKSITEYIDSKMTATIINNHKKTTNKETVTSELIYYWMIALNIPFECQKWHLNRLLTLIDICSIKNAPPKKMSKNEVLSRNAALNAARKQSMNTRG